MEEAKREKAVVVMISMVWAGEAGVDVQRVEEKREVWVWERVVAKRPEPYQQKKQTLRQRRYRRYRDQRSLHDH